MYLTSLQSYHGVNQWELDALRQLGSLRREIRLALDGGEAARSARSAAATATMVMNSLSGSLAGGSPAQLHGLRVAIEQTRSAAARVTDHTESSAGNDLHETEARAALDQLSAAVQRAREELRLVRDSSILRP